jgi:hypothetical protein
MPMRKMLSILMLTVAFATMNATETNATGMVSRWEFNQTNNIFANSIADNPRLVASSNWSGVVVNSLDGDAAAIYFPGWTNLVSGNTVDKSASMLTAEHTQAYNADGYSFAFGAYVKAIDPQSLLDSGVLLKSDTLNIIQKGLSGPTKQQWKLSISTAGKFICSFRGPDNTGAIKEFKVVSKRYSYNVPLHVSCKLSDEAISMNIATDSRLDSYSSVGPQMVVNESDITIGKKPGSNDPGDTFAGTIDGIFIEKY